MKSLCPVESGQLCTHELAWNNEDIPQASECMKVGCLTVRGWVVGKCKNTGKELDEWKYDVVGLTETHL